MKMTFFKELFANALNNYVRPIGEPILLPNGGYRKAFAIKKTKDLCLNIKFLNTTKDDDVEAELTSCPMSVYYLRVVDFNMNDIKTNEIEFLIGVTHQSTIDAGEMILRNKDLAFNHIENILVDHGYPLCDAIDGEVIKNAQRYIRAKRWCKRSWLDKFVNKEAVVEVANDNDSISA